MAAKIAPKKHHGPRVELGNNMYDFLDILRILKMEVKKLHVLMIVGLHSYPTINCRSISHRKHNVIRDNIYSSRC